MITLGSILPWIISLGPYDAPLITAKMLRTEATAVVILSLDLQSTMIVTSAVNAMIEAYRRSRRVQSSKYVHLVSNLKLISIYVVYYHRFEP
jgi:hypothetical protein